MTTLTRRTALLAVLTAVLLPLLPSQAKPAPKPQPARVALPSWAPKKPSKEFLRAAKVLKPVPEEAQGYSPIYPAAYELFGSLTDKQMAEFLTRKQHVEPTASLDEETRQMRKQSYGATEAGGKLVYYRHEVILPVKSLTAPQRKAFDRLLAAWGGLVEQATDGDMRVRLYKMGATKDFSNVGVGFTTAAHSVRVALFVATPVGTGDAHGATPTVYQATMVWFAQIDAVGPTAKERTMPGAGSDRGGGSGGGRR
jgi:hypothetical protein